MRHCSRNNKITILIFITVFLGCEGCGDDTDSDSVIDTGTGSNTDTATNTDTGAVTDTTTEPDMNKDTNTDTNTVKDTVVDTMRDTDALADSHTDEDSDTSDPIEPDTTDTDSGTDTGQVTIATDSDSEALDETCTQITELKPGSNYGDYSLFAIRVNDATAPGQYSMRAGDANDGTALILADDVSVGEFTYDPSESLENSILLTVAVGDFFELDLKSNTKPTLEAINQSIFNGCHVVVVTDFTEVSVGETYGNFMVEGITIPASLESGTYSFYAESGNAGTVALRRDAVTMETLDYVWTTAMGPDISYVFEFQAGVTLQITLPERNSNLFPLAAGLFNGRHGFIFP